MSEAPWNNYQEDDQDTAVADGPWSTYADEEYQPGPTLPRFGMQEAANSIPLPGYTTPFGQNIERTARAMVQSQPSEQALAAGAFLNRQTLEPPPMPDGLAESGNMEGFGSMGNVDPALYRDTLKESVKQLTPSPQTVRSAREYVSLLGSLAHPENPNSTEEALGRLAGPDLPPEGIDKAIAGGLGATYRQVESFLQPEQLPLLLAGSIPGKLGTAVTAAFYADMVRHSPEVFNNVMDALESGDTQREAEALTEAAVHAAFLGLTGKHTADSLRQGVDSFIHSNGPEARRRYYEQMEQSQRADLAPIAQPEAFGVSTPEAPAAPTTPVEPKPAPTDEVPRIEGEIGKPAPTEESFAEGLTPEEKVDQMSERDLASHGFTEPKPEPSPAVDLSGKVSKMTPDEFGDYAKSLKDKGGFTTAAYELGASAPSQEFVNELRTRADSFEQKWRDTMKQLQAEPDPMKKMAMLDAISKISSQKQFFEEAWQYATGKGSGGEMAAKQGHVPKFTEAPKPTEPAPVEDKLRSPIAQVPIPEHFKSAEDVINFRNQRRSEELDLYKKEIGLTQEEAERLQAIMEREGSTQKFEKDIGPEKAQKLNDLFDGPQNQRDNPHAFRFWDYSKGFNPEDVATESDKSWIARQLIWALQHDVYPNPESDRFLFSIVAARRLKELGGTKSDIARELDQYTTRNAGSSGDKAESFVDNGKKISAFLQAHGIELPEGELGKSKTTSDPIVKALDKAIDRLGVDPSKSFADPFFVQSVGKPVARAALIAARAAYKTSKDVGQAIRAGLRNLHAAGVRFNTTLTQVHAQQWLHSMLTAPKPSGLSRALGNLNRKRQAFGSLFRSEGNRKLMDQTFDAVENMANIAGQQARKTLDIGTKPIEREATLAVIEANGDITKLDLFEQQAKAGDHAGAERAVNYARANWAALQPLANRMKRLMNDQVADEHTNGITTEYHEAYVPHIYDKDLWMGAGRPFVVGTGGGGGAATGFKKGRSFPTIFDAIEAGYHPQTLDVGKLAEHRVKNGQKLINRKQWGEMLSTVHDPTDGRSIVTAMVRKSRGPGRPGYEVAPMGYVPREIIPGVRVAIHEGYSPLFDAMTATSRISGNAVGQMLLQTEGALKHGLLLFDTFHASRIIQKQLVLTGRLDAGARGHTLLEYSNADLGRATAAGLITPEMAQWVRANHPTANLLIKSGLNVGRVSEALYTSFVREIPVLGTFNKWVFEKLTRGALLQAGLIEFARVSKALPHLSPQQVALKVSRDLNAYFGNLGRQGLFKSGTGQDLARLVFLAPNWVESMARTETKGALQTVKGLTYDPIVHKKLLTGTIGKGVAQGLLAYFIGTQLLNLVTRGQPTWKNPEDKHKLDAWIPDLSGKGGHGFFLSPFSVVAELTHDMIRYAQSEGTSLKAAAKIGGNKLSPPARALKILATGRDFDKTHIDSTWGRVKAAGMALAPTPIPLAPVIKGTQYPGQTQRQLTASMGFKTEPAESPTQQISEKARKFLAGQGKAHPFDFEPTEDPSYAKLRAIIRKGDDQEALGMLGELEKNHTGKQVLTAMRQHVRHPFTGSKSQEWAFLGSLNDQEAGLYDKARDEQKAEYDTFLKLWYSRQGAPATTNEQPAAASAPWLRY